MGKDVPAPDFAPHDRTAYRQKVRTCLDALGLMLSGSTAFDGRNRMTGLEIELNLMDRDAEPAMRNQEVLEGLADPTFQTELGRFNLELNARPRLIAGNGFADYEKDLQDSLARAEDRANKADCTIVMVGSLPTLTPSHLTVDALSDNERYRALNDQMVGARGDYFALDIEGVERLTTATDSIAPEAACTSVQFHMQVPPEQFAGWWNASQAAAGIQVALGANSPWLHGRRLWAETRIALFKQATDTRPEELRAQGVRPRVWFGERWITSVFDLFEENVRYFGPLLPVLSDEDPMSVLAAGDVPRLSELCLHNGTVYRWNRPVYDIRDGRPHLRVENRVLPAGPTVVDLLANAAFYFGLVRELADDERPVWSRLSFATAEENFLTASRHGIEAEVWWPGRGETSVTDLVRRCLLPKAEAGLDKLGVAREHRDRLLAVIDGRCRTRRNGAVWQTEAVAAAERNRGLDRSAALHDMLLRYGAFQWSNQPVHEWPVV